LPATKQCPKWPSYPDAKLSTYPHTIDILNEKRDQKVGFCAGSLYEEQQFESYLPNTQYSGSLYILMVFSI
jgi:hypothetical protein